MPGSEKTQHPRLGPIPADQAVLETRPGTHTPRTLLPDTQPAQSRADLMKGRGLQSQVLRTIFLLTATVTIPASLQNCKTEPVNYVLFTGQQSVHLGQRQMDGQCSEYCTGNSVPTDKLGSPQIGLGTHHMAGRKGWTRRGHQEVLVSAPSTTGCQRCCHQTLCCTVTCQSNIHSLLRHMTSGVLGF